MFCFQIPNELFFQKFARQEQQYQIQMRRLTSKILVGIISATLESMSYK